MFRMLTMLLKQLLKFLNFPEKKLEKKEFLAFKSSAQSTDRFELNLKDSWYISEKTSNTNFDRHYVYHTAWAARCVQKISPELHIDISSSLYFCGIVSAFCKIDFYDYRPADLVLSNLNCLRADLTSLEFPDNSIQSLSCMHTIEHIGLGRYGDPLDYDGDIKAINELKRVTAPGGNLLIVVPAGKKSKIIFNAHRIYHPSLLLTYFDGFDLLDFSLIPENGSDGGLIKNPGEYIIQTQDYACGCYWFKKHLSDINRNG